MPYKDPERAREYSREYQRKRFAADPERVRAWHRAKRAADPERYREIGRRFYVAHRAEEIAKDVPRNRERYARLRIAALVAYGGEPPRCACCGEWRVEFLTLDHSDRRGAEHRRELRAAHLNIWEWCRREGYPADRGLRVLCANCNTATAYRRACPHEAERSTLRHSA